MPMASMIHNAKAALKATVRQRAVLRAVKPLRSNGTLTRAQIGTFRKAWGNEGFAADGDFLEQVLNCLGHGPVLECGTGGTTLLEDAMALRNGFEVFCLEQEPSWADEVRNYRLNTVKIINASLKNFGDFYWYDAPDTLPQHFGLVVCDGPYIDKKLGEPYYSAWRYGVLPWFKETGRTFRVLLLDDVECDRGSPLLGRWQREFGVQIETVQTTEGQCAIIKA
jgi:hypothetical protein